MKAVNTFDHDAAPVTVEASPGRISVHAAGLLLRHGEALAIDFTERVMGHTAVESVLVDRLLGIFTITYDRFQRTPRQALIEISDCLRSSSTYDGHNPTGPLPRGAIRTSPFQLDSSETASRSDRRFEPDRSIAPPAFRPVPARMKASGMTRLFYLTAAGGCLSGAIVASSCREYRHCPSAWQRVSSWFVRVPGSTNGCVNREPLEASFAISRITAASAPVPSRKRSSWLWRLEPPQSLSAVGRHSHWPPSQLHSSM